RPHAARAVRAAGSAPAARRPRSLHARDPYLDAKRAVLFVDPDVPAGAELRQHALLQQFEAEAGPAAARPIRIARVLERDRDVGVDARRRDADRAAVDELTDAVHDRVLDERLEQERRDETRGRIRIRLARDMQAGTQAHALDLEKAIGEREFLG